MKDKSEIINQVIQQKRYKTYLEIGTQTAKNFKAIDCEVKHGVDPAVDSPYNVQLTSDEFFAQTKNTYDIIFIDGLHEAEQVARDIHNSLRVLNYGGCIVLHDTIPQSEEMQLVPRIQRVWTGDVWRAVIGFAKNNPKVELYTHRADWGLTFIFPTGEIINTFEVSDISYQEFKQNEVKLLNIID